MSGDLRSCEDLIQHLDSDTDRLTANYKDFYRAIIAAAYNFGKIDAMRGDWELKKVERKKQEDVDAFVKRLWEDDGK